MPRKRLVTAFWVAIATLSMTFASLSTANASTASSSPVPVAGGRHCVQQAMSARQVTPHAEVCFATYADSVSYLTAGTIRLATTARVQDTTPQLQARIVAAAAVTPSTTYILSIEYQDYDWGGASWTFTGTTDCNGSGAPFWVSSMPSGWTNSIGSSKAYSACQARHYDNSGATATNIPAGSVYVCSNTTSCGHLGAMNDATNSMRWT